MRMNGIELCTFSVKDFRNSYLMDIRVKWSREYLISIWNFNRFKSPILPQIGNTHEMYVNGNSGAHGNKASESHRSKTFICLLIS